MVFRCDLCCNHGRSCQAGIRKWVRQRTAGTLDHGPIGQDREGLATVGQRARGRPPRHSTIGGPRAVENMDCEGPWNCRGTTLRARCCSSDVTIPSLASHGGTRLRTPRTDSRGSSEGPRFGNVATRDPASQVSASCSFHPGSRRHVGPARHRGGSALEPAVLDLQHDVILPEEPPVVGDDDQGPVPLALAIARSSHRPGSSRSHRAPRS